MTQISIHYTGDIVTKKEAIELSLTRYFTGKPCPKNHTSERYTRNSGCCYCAYLATKEPNGRLKQKYNKEYYKNNSRRILENRKIREDKTNYNKNYMKNYREINKDKIKIKAKEWYKKNYKDNKEAIKQKSREWYKNNKDTSKVKSKEYQERNKESVLERRKQYRQENKQKIRANIHNRKAKKRGNGGTHTGKQAEELLIKQKYKCVYCPEKLTEGNRHKDHIMPLALGGTNNIDNLQWLCPKCNLSKGAKHPTIYALEIGMLL